jgi:hypothetical protein
MFRYIRVWWLLYRSSHIDPNSHSRMWPGWTSGFWRTYLRQQVVRDRAGLPLLGDEPQEPPCSTGIAPEYTSPDSWGLSAAAACGDAGDAGYPSAGGVYLPTVQHSCWTGPKHSLPEQDQPTGPAEHVGADEDWSPLAEVGAMCGYDDFSSCQPRHTRRDGVFDAIVADLKFAADRFDDVVGSEQQRRAATLEALDKHWAASYDTAYLDTVALEKMLAETASV